jgi:protein XagA
MLKGWIGIGFCLLSPSAASAGAWTLPEGTGQMVVTATASSATSVFDGNGLAPTPRYNKLELQGLMEYGITDRFTAIFEPELQHIDIAAPTQAQRTGLGYTEAGGRYRFLQGDSDGGSWLLSGQATLRLPGTSETSNPASIGYTDAQADIRALLGRSFTFRAMPVFVDLELAERFRSAGAPDEFRVDGTLGVQATSQWLFLAQSFDVVSEGSVSPVFGSYGYYKLQLSAVYLLTPSWSLQLGGYTTYAGNNALQENGMVFGVWHRF